MFNKLRVRFGRFRDGTRIKQISREEFIYSKQDGHSVIVYVYWVTGHEGNIDRVLVKSTINHWIEPDVSQIIPEKEQNEIINKFSEYFHVNGDVMDIEE